MILLTRWLFPMHENVPEPIVVPSLKNKSPIERGVLSILIFILAYLILIAGNLICLIQNAKVNAFNMFLKSELYKTTRATIAFSGDNIILPTTRVAIS